MANQKVEIHIPPRLELFSDAVFAIITTLMVLELLPPKGHDLRDLFPLWPLFFAYFISFTNLYINWQNHHHLLSTMTKPTAGIMLANGNLLFWASLIPFVTAWFGEHPGYTIPTVLYALVFLLYAVSYVILQKQILIEEGKNSILGKAILGDKKERNTLLAHVAAVVLAFFLPWVAIGIIVIIAAYWFFPDKRIENELKKSDIL